MQVVKAICWLALTIAGVIFLLSLAYAAVYVFGATPVVSTNGNVTTEQRNVPAKNENSSRAEEKAPEPVCDVPGSVFVKDIGQCVYHMTDPVQVQKYSPDMDSDSKCKGKPSGFRYDEKVRDEAGHVGIAHRVCGSRPAN